MTSSSEITLSQIEEQARNLTADGRARLANAMLETLHESCAATEIAWQSEITERTATYARGDIASYSAEEVLAEAHRIVK